jgi:hypothetical protein
MILLAILRNNDSKTRKSLQRQRQAQDEATRLSQNQYWEHQLNTYKPVFPQLAQIFSNLTSSHSKKTLASTINLMPLQRIQEHKQHPTCGNKFEKPLITLN